MAERLLPTGGAGLDAILNGGFPAGGLHLVQAPPGAGKTTLALQFLLEGARAGETGLYVTPSQTGSELRKIADSHGWDLEGIEIVELQPEGEFGAADQTIFQTSDLRLDRTRQAVEEAVERTQPQRMVYDSLLEMRLMTPDMGRYHRELVRLRTLLERQGITALLIDTTELPDDTIIDTQARGLVRGIVTMSKTLPTFGGAQRRIEITKMRGVAIHDGWHDMDIRTGEGVVVFPRVVPAAGEPRGDGAAPRRNSRPLVRSGIERLDSMFGGGLEPGTTTMVVGQAGTGKSTIASLYAAAALNRGERVALFLFEERLETFFRRCEGLGIDLRAHAETGRLDVFDYSPDEVSPGELSQIVQAQAENADLGMVVIDSLTGYVSSLSEPERALFDLHGLMKFLARREILTIVIVAQAGLLGQDGGSAALDLTFMGDTLLLLRMHERDGAVERTIAPIKKRHGPHSMSVYDLVIQTGGIVVGDSRPDT